MEIRVSRGIQPTLLSKALNAGAADSPFDGTFEIQTTTKRIHPLTCEQGQGVRVITVRLEQMDPPEKPQEDNHVVAGIIEIRPEQPTVLFEKENQDVTTEKLVARHTLTKGCLEAQCDTNGCRFKDMKNWKEERRNEARLNNLIKTQNSPGHR